MKAGLCPRTEFQKNIRKTSETIEAQRMQRKRRTWQTNQQVEDKSNETKGTEDGQNPFAIDAYMDTLKNVKQQERMTRKLSGIILRNQYTDTIVKFKRTLSTP